jgi:hypothetical protein
MLKCTLSKLPSSTALATLAARWVIVLVALHGPAPLDAQGAGESAGEPSSPGILRPLTGPPSGTSLRWPSIARSRDTLWVVANLFPIARGERVPERALYLIREPGGPLVPPQGPYAFAYPRLLAGNSASIHLLWGEPDTLRSEVSSWPGRITRVLHSQYVAGKWSEPDVAVSGTNLTWAADGNPALVDSRGRLHVTLPGMYGGSYSHRLLHVVRRGDDWHFQELPFGASYSSGAVLSADSLVIVYAGSDVGLHANNNSLFAVFSGDGGSTWSDPVVLRRSVSNVALEPLITRSRRGDLEVVFLHESATGGAVVERMSPGSSAGEWKETGGSAPLAGIAHRLRVLRGPCDEVQAFVEVFDGTKPRVARVIWSAPGTTTNWFQPAEGWIVTPAAVVANGRMEILVQVVGSGAAAPTPLLVTEEQERCR